MTLATSAIDQRGPAPDGYRVEFAAEASADMRAEDEPKLGAAFDPALRPLVARAVDDLATRLGIDSRQVQVLQAKAVVWPDSSLGCPQPGMAYKQVPEDGALILLKSGTRRYEYHSGGSRGLFLCERSVRTKEAPVKLDPFGHSSRRRRSD
ncbi:MAG: hypothetical protein JSW68_10350 [Burkholderiales bacterium]|nr:MAG: hypothetical protein JSW68_10350 [Burkholderiales bacterium]